MWLQGIAITRRERTGIRTVSNGYWAGRFQQLSMQGTS